jgi:hypothetical protein
LIVSNGVHYVLSGYNGISTSTNSINWVVRYANRVESLTWNGTYWVGVEFSSGKVVYSSDTVNWTLTDFIPLNSQIVLRSLGSRSVIQSVPPTFSTALAYSNNFYILGFDRNATNVAQNYSVAILSASIPDDTSTIGTNKYYASPKNPVTAGFWFYVRRGGFYSISFCIGRPTANVVIKKNCLITDNFNTDDLVNILNTTTTLNEDCISFGRQLNGNIPTLTCTVYIPANRVSTFTADNGGYGVKLFAGNSGNGTIGKISYLRVVLLTEC